MVKSETVQAGSWVADFHPDLTQQEGDIILQPHKSSDVLQTDLKEELEKRGTTHLVTIKNCRRFISHDLNLLQ